MLDLAITTFSERKLKSGNCEENFLCYVELNRDTNERKGPYGQ